MGFTMLIITQDARQAFLTEVNQCVVKNEIWRCMIFSFSKTGKKPESWFSSVTEKIHHCLGSDSGRIFLDTDGDLYVLGKHITEKSYQFLLEKISPIFLPTAISNLSTLQELPVDKDKIEKFIGNKCIDIQKTQENTEPSSSSLYIDDFHRPHIEAISAKRKKRQNIGILIVEDDLFSQRLVAKSLEREFDVFTAASGQDAIFAYITHAPDIVFLDIGLPDASGLEVLQKLQEMDPDLYVVMLSANGNRANILKAVENGAKGFIGKPFPREKLIQSIKNCPTAQAKGK